MERHYRSMPLIFNHNSKHIASEILKHSSNHIAGESADTTDTWHCFDALGRDRIRVAIAFSGDTMEAWG
jgi:hypothetical protein